MPDNDTQGATTMATGRRTRGNFYAYTSVPTDRTCPRGGPVRMTNQVGWQLRTFAEAKKRVDDSGLPGYVEYWSEPTQRRIRTAQLDDAGAWWGFEPFTGERVPLKEKP